VDFKKANFTLEQARKEVILLFQLQHPNIIQFSEHFVQDKYIYIVMEYADGGDLLEKIKAQYIPFEEDFIINIFTQLASALSECKKNSSS
jgi:serine/threonine protein kinase